MSAFTSPLQLRDFQIVKFHFEVSEGREPDLGAEQQATLDFDLRFRDEEQNDCLLILRHCINEASEDFDRCGFRVLATVGGVFELAAIKEEYSDDERWHGFLLVNGLSMLYSMLRQLVAQIGAQSPMPSVMLPTLNMQEFLKAYVEAQASEEQAASAAK